MKLLVEQLVYKRCDRVIIDPAAVLPPLHDPGKLSAMGRRRLAPLLAPCALALPLRLPCLVPKVKASSADQMTVKNLLYNKELHRILVLMPQNRLASVPRPKARGFCRTPEPPSRRDGIGHHALVYLRLGDALHRAARENGSCNTRHRAAPFPSAHAPLTSVLAVSTFRPYYALRPSRADTFITSDTLG